MDRQVLQLLKDNNLLQYEEALRRCGVFSLSSFARLDNERLRDAGVSELTDRKKLISLSEKSKKSSAVAVRSPRGGKKEEHSFGSSLANYVEEDDEEEEFFVVPQKKKTGTTPPKRDVSSVSPVTAAPVIAVQDQGAVKPAPPVIATNSVKSAAQKTTKEAAIKQEWSNKPARAKEEQTKLQSLKRVQEWSRLSMPLTRSESTVSARDVDATSHGLTAEELSNSAIVTVSLFGMRTSATFRDGCVWFSLKSGDLAHLARDCPLTLFSSAIAKKLPDGSWMVNRVGLVKMIACAMDSDELLEAIVGSSAGMIQVRKKEKWKCLISR